MKRKIERAVVKVMVALIAVLVVGFSLPKSLATIYIQAPSTIRSVTMTQLGLVGSADAGDTTVIVSLCAGTPCLVPDGSFLMYWQCTIPCNDTFPNSTIVADSHYDGGLEQCTIYTPTIQPGPAYLYTSTLRQGSGCTVRESIDMDLTSP